MKTVEQQMREDFALMREDNDLRVVTNFDNEWRITIHLVRPSQYKHFLRWWEPDLAH